jgi:hypothetical protein
MAGILTEEWLEVYASKVLYKCNRGRVSPREEGMVGAGGGRERPSPR